MRAEVGFDGFRDSKRSLNREGDVRDTTISEEAVYDRRHLPFRRLLAVFSEGQFVAGAAAALDGPADTMEVVLALGEEDPGRGTRYDYQKLRDPAKDATSVRRTPHPVPPGAVYRSPARPRADGDMAPLGADHPKVLNQIPIPDQGS